MLDGMDMDMDEHDLRIVGEGYRTCAAVLAGDSLALCCCRGDTYTC